jgi:hypothetical protein
VWFDAIGRCIWSVRPTVTGFSLHIILHLECSVDGDGLLPVEFIYCLICDGLFRNKVEC